MITIPAYMPSFYNVFPDLVIELLTKVEENFDTLNYTHHTASIMHVLEMPDITSKDCTDQILEIYRENIDTLLSLQGIFLANPNTDKLDDIVSLLSAVTQLSAVKLTELYELEEANKESTEEVLFASILSLLSEKDIEVYLRLIKSVTARTMQYIWLALPITELIQRNVNYYKNRYCSSSLYMDGIVTMAIKKQNFFGYTVELFIHQCGDQIKELDYVNAATEIGLLVLGSNTPSEQVLPVALDTATLLLNDNYPKLSKVNNQLKKLLGETND